LPLIKKPTR